MDGALQKGVHLIDEYEVTRCMTYVVVAVTNYTSKTCARDCFYQ